MVFFDLVFFDLSICMPNKYQISAKYLLAIHKELSDDLLQFYLLLFSMVATSL